MKQVAGSVPQREPWGQHYRSKGSCGFRELTEENAPPSPPSLPDRRPSENWLGQNSWGVAACSRGKPEAGGGRMCENRVFKWGPQTCTISIISELIRNATWWLIPDLLNQKFRAGPSSVGFNRPSWQFWYMLKFGKRKEGSLSLSCLFRALPGDHRGLQSLGQTPASPR